MNREQLIKKLEVALDEWEKNHTWGTIELEIHDGLTVLLRKETKEKFTSTGGHSNVPRRETRSY